MVKSIVYLAKSGRGSERQHNVTLLLRTATLGPTVTGVKAEADIFFVGQKGEMTTCAWTWAGMLRERGRCAWPCHHAALPPLALCTLIAPTVCITFQEETHQDLYVDKMAG